MISRVFEDIQNTMAINTHAIDYKEKIRDSLQKKILTYDNSKNSEN